MTKPILVIGAGLAAVGKSTFLRRLHAALANSVYIDKDAIQELLLQDEDRMSAYGLTARKHTYDMIAALAEQNLIGSRIVIVDSYFVGRSASLRRLFSKYQTRVLLFETSADKHYERLKQRNSSRDVEKLSSYEKFLHYRENESSVLDREFAGLAVLRVHTEYDSVANAVAFIRNVSLALL